MQGLKLVVFARAASPAVYQLLNAARENGFFAQTAGIDAAASHEDAWRKTVQRAVEGVRPGTLVVVLDAERAILNRASPAELRAAFDAFAAATGAHSAEGTGCYFHRAQTARDAPVLNQAADARLAADAAGVTVANGRAHSAAGQAPPVIVSPAPGGTAQVARQLGYADAQAALREIAKDFARNSEAAAPRAPPRRSVMPIVVVLLLVLVLARQSSR